MDMEKVGGNITYGTKGLPKFGTNAIDGSRSTEIAKLDTVFNHLLNEVKALTAPGNEIALMKFGQALEGIYWPAYNCVAGRPVVNA